MKYFLFPALLLSASLLGGCATLFKGYYDTVDVIGAPPVGLTITTGDGVDVPLIRSIEHQPTSTIYGEFTGKYVDVPVTQIMLRSDKDHILHIRYQNEEKIIAVYKKPGWGWMLLDMFVFVIGPWFDYTTGNWNYFDPITITTTP